jgi:hypothetical protein
MPRKTKTDEEGTTAEKTAAEGATSVAKAAAAKEAPGEIPKYRIGDKVVLTVREPVSPQDGRAETLGNYIPQRFVGEVEAINLEADVPSIRVRWHLPSSYGYDTQEGTLSTLVYIANGVWLEARKKPRNVTATIDAISEDAYKTLLTEAAKN